MLETHFLLALDNWNPEIRSVWGNIDLVDMFHPQLLNDYVLCSIICSASYCQHGCPLNQCKQFSKEQSYTFSLYPNTKMVKWNKKNSDAFSWQRIGCMHANAKNQFFCEQIFRHDQSHNLFSSPKIKPTRKSLAMATILALGWNYSKQKGFLSYLVDRMIVELTIGQTPHEKHWCLFCSLTWWL